MSVGDELLNVGGVELALRKKTPKMKKRFSESFRCMEVILLEDLLLWLWWLGGLKLWVGSLGGASEVTLATLNLK